MTTVPAEPPNVIYGLFHVDEPDRIRYVGQTTKTARRRYKNHCNTAIREDGSKDYRVPVHRWMRKHGVQKIEYTILQEVPRVEDLDDAETAWIEKLGTLTRLRGGGLNVSPGGGSARGVTLSAQTKEILRQKRQKLLPEQVADIKLRIWNGGTLKRVAGELGVDVGTVRRISQRKIYLDTPWPIGPARKPDYLEDERERVASLMSIPDIRERHSAGLKQSWTAERKAEQSKRYAEGGHPMQGKPASLESRRARALKASTVSVEEVREIRRLRSEENLQYKAIRERVGEHVSLGTIGGIIRGDYYSLVA